MREPPKLPIAVYPAQPSPNPAERERMVREFKEQQAKKWPNRRPKAKRRR